MNTALDRMTRMASEGGEPLMDALGSAGMGGLLMLLMLFVITIELWVFAIKTSRLGSKSGLFWAAFMPFPIAMLTIRLLSPEGWAAAIGWHEPMLANLALAGFDIEGGAMTADQAPLREALTYTLSGRAGQILLPSLMLAGLGWFLVKQNYQKWQQSKRHLVNTIIGGVLLLFSVPPLFNKPTWNAWMGNTDAFEQQITILYTRELTLPGQ